MNFVRHNTVIFKGMPKWNSSSKFWDIEMKDCQTKSFLTYAWEVDEDF
jgi:hypothetical protein